MIQSDISIEHRKRRGPGNPEIVYVMHPFKNSKGANAGRYEILRDFKGPAGKTVKRSAHVTDGQLAELFARDLLSSLNIRMRVKPFDQPYPTSAPGKPIRYVHVRKGSTLDNQIRSVDTSRPADGELQEVLHRLGAGERSSA